MTGWYSPIKTHDEEKNTMRKSELLSLILAGTMTVAASGCAKVVEPKRVPTAATEAEAKEIRPQDDYYYYINKERVDNATFEYGETTAASSFEQASTQEKVEKIIRNVADGSGYENGSEEDVIQKAYQAFMRYDFENEKAPQDLVELLEKINQASSVQELMDIDAVLVRDYYLGSMLNVSVNNDVFQSGKKTIEFGQTTTVLSAGFADIREDDDALDTLQQYGKLIRRAMGYDTDRSDAEAKALAYLTLDLFQSTNLEQMDELFGYDHYEVLTVDEAYANFESFDLKKYFTDLGLSMGAVKTVNIKDKKQFDSLSKIFAEENLEALKTWEMGRLMNQYSRFLAVSYPELSGLVSADYSSKEEQAVMEVGQEFIRETDPLYVEQYYTDEMDQALRAMCDDIKGGYRKLISQATWLSETTRKELLSKLDGITYVTGKDMTRHDNTLFETLDGSNYYELLKNYHKIFRQKTLSGLSGTQEKSIDMPMQIVNACYNPFANTITITCAITNAPFFDVKADYFTNLGGLGMTIAHEMGHAFDSTGILFRKDGVYDPEWLDDADLQVLMDRNEKAADYFEKNFTVFGLYHVDGKRTLGENYADLGAMECVTLLADTKEELRLLFENYAATWCEMKTDTVIINQLAYDEHSPEVIRVNAILSTLETYYEVYDVKEGDGMYIAPEKRISRWHE